MQKKNKKNVKKCILLVFIFMCILGLIGTVKLNTKSKEDLSVNNNYDSSFPIDLKKNLLKKTLISSTSIYNGNLINKEIVDDGVYTDVYVPSMPQDMEGAIEEPTLESAYQYIIDSETDGGIIHVTGDISVDQISIDKDIKVSIKSEGNTHTITKNGSGKNMFSLTNGGSLILENIVVDASNNTEGRTVILENESVLALNENAILENNKSYGAVFSDNSSVIVNGGMIQNNHTTNGIDIGKSTERHTSEDFEGGAVLLVKNSSFKMNNGEISNNSAKNGGAIYGINPKGMTINGGIFDNNKTVDQDGNSQYGGVIGFWNANDCTISVTGKTVFKNNNGQLGGVFFIKGQNTIIDINGAEFAENVGAQYGGTINCQNTDSTMVLNNCSFKNNTGLAGGVVYLNQSTDVDISNCTFENNTAKAGGVIAHQGFDYKMSIKNSSFIGNKASMLAGGAILVSHETKGECDVSLENCTFNENKSRNEGGAVLFKSGEAQDSSISATGCTFLNNTTETASGGAIHTTNAKSITFNNCKIAGSKAETSGGGMSIYNEGQRKCDVSLENCTFNENKSKSGGGAVFLKSGETQGSLISANGCTFLNNTTETASGGAIHTTNAKSIALNNCEIARNKAETNGGGVSIYNNTTKYSLIEINGVKFSSNSADIDGGGLDIVAQNADVIIDKGTEFSKNIASANGGGLWIGRFGEENANVSVTLVECNIINNISNGDCTTYKKYNPDDERRCVTLQHYNAGGVYIGEDVTLYISNALVTDNSVKSGYEENVIADGIGLCPNAEAYFYEDGNISIYGNGTNGMDILAVPYDSYVNREELPKLYIADKMSDGRKYNWTNLEGEEARTGDYNWDKALETKEEVLKSERMKEEIAKLSNQNEEYGGEETLDPIGFKANVGSSKTRTVAEEDDGYKVHIIGNTSENAAYGAGGLMVNGKVIASHFAVTVEKKTVIQGEVSNEKKQEINNRDFKFKLSMEDKNGGSIAIPTSSGKKLKKTDLEGTLAETEDITWNKNGNSNIGFNFTLKGNQKMITDEINKNEVGLNSNLNSNMYNFALEETDSGGADTVSVTPDNNQNHREISNILFTCKNTFKFGGLNITKNVESVGNKDKEWTFKIHVDNAEGEYFAELWENNEKVSDTHVSFTSGNASIQLKHGQTLKIKDLPVNASYTVSEENTDDNYVSSSTGETGTISDKAIAEVVFTNTVQTGNLNVTKQVTGEAGDVSRDWNFTVTLDDTTINGECGEMTFENGVAKFTLKHGESKHAEGLPQGVGYKVEEQEANQEGYTTTSESAEGKISSTENAEVTFTNEKRNETGGINVTKKVTGEAGDVNRDWNFTVTLDDTTINGEYGEMTFENGVAKFTLKHGESKHAEGLPQGVGYKVEEQEANEEGYTTTSESAEGQISSTEDAEVTFTNEKRNETGGINVTKKVTGDAGDVSRDWNFTVTLDDTTINGEYGEMTFENGVAKFTLKHGESKTATGLPENVTYTVTEAEANQEGYTTTSEGAKGTISLEKDAKVTFTNEKTNKETIKTGSIVVSKSVVGAEKNKEEEFEFTITLDDTTINGKYGDMTFKNGVAKFTLKDGEEKMATELPINVKYEVEEKKYSDYTTESTNEKGIVEESKTVNVKFVNTKKDDSTAPGKLPQTGLNTKVWTIATSVTVAIVSFVLYKKYPKL